MASNLIPFGQARMPRPSRKEQRLLDSVRLQAVAEQASIRARGVLATEVMREIDDASTFAILGHDRVSKVVAAVARDDLITADEAKGFLDVARLGKMAVLSSLVTDLDRDL